MLRRFAPPPDRVLTISHEGSDFQVLVRAKTAARRLTLRVESATRRVVLTMPARAGIATAQDFALRHGGWIAARVARLPAPAPFEPDAIVPLRGVEHRIVPAPHLRGRVVTANCEDRGLVLRVGGESAHLARRVADFSKGRGAAGPRRRRRPAFRNGRLRAGADQHPRYPQSLGVLQRQPPPLLLLEADPGARARAELLGRP